MSPATIHKLYTKNARVGFALQGGGSLGSYVRGAANTLLGSKVIPVALTGTSSGSINASLIASGLSGNGSPEQAMQQLNDYWNKEVAEHHAAGKCAWLNRYMSSTWPYPNLLQSRGSSRVLRAMRLPHMIEEQMERHIDWRAIHDNPNLSLFVNTVEEDLATSRHRHIVYTGDSVNSQAVAKSSALPELGGYTDTQKPESMFWDGAMRANPCTKGILTSGITDLIVVTVQRAPKVAIQPVDQLEKSRNYRKAPGKLVKEDFHHHVEWISQNHPDINLHSIALVHEDHWDDTCKMNTNPEWLKDLEARGTADAEQWLLDHGPDIGKKSSYSKAHHHFRNIQLG